MTLLAVVSLAMSPSASAGGADWPRAGYDGGASRYNVRESTLTTSNVGWLQLDWMRRVRPDVQFIYEYEADVALVAGGRVFAAWSGSEALYDVLTAYDETTGERLWTAREADGVRPIAATDTTVIAGIFTRPRSVRAFDAATGATRWTYEGALPMVADHGVRHVIAVGWEPDERWIASIDVATGDVVWSRRLRVRTGGWGRVLLSGGRVVVQVKSERGRRLVVLRADDGTTVWSQRVRGDPVVAAEGRILTIRFARREPLEVVEALRLSGGPVVWSFRSPYFTMVAAAGDGRVFLNRSTCVSGCEGEGFGLHRGRVIALDGATGRVLWDRRGNAAKGPTLWQAAALVDGVLFVARGELGRARFGALDASNGELRWSVTFGPRDVVGNLDAVANGAVFGGIRFGRRGGRIVRFVLPGGGSEGWVR